MILPGEKNRQHKVLSDGGVAAGEGKNTQWVEPFRIPRRYHPPFRSDFASVARPVSAIAIHNRPYTHNRLDQWSKRS